MRMILFLPKPSAFMKALLLGWALALASSLFSQDIIPQPRKIQRHGEKRYEVSQVKVVSSELSHPEEYVIEARRGVVRIMGNEVWARQTLEQLKDEEGRIPDVTIRDWPAYPFRGFMHDTGRNYQPLGMLKETIDLMSFYKLNYFHWHLTDHPAWRIECRVYPQLNDPQYQRPGRDPGAYYTYDEIRELIAYASEKGITVVPEIDMPGHSTYFKTAFGFSMDSPQGRQVLERCLDEFFAEIPQSSCPYVHIGSDEVHIEDPQGFMQWAESVAERHGRIAIAWDPGLPASDKVVRQIWNTAAGSNAAAAGKGGLYLDSFMGYLNYYDPMMFTNKVFLHTAAAQTTPDPSHALGGILCLWNDVRVDKKENIALHNGMLNGMMAFAERFWVGGDAGAVEDESLAPSPDSEAGTRLAQFEQRMKAHRDRYHHGKMRWVANALMRWEIAVDSLPPRLAYGGAVDLDAFCSVNDIEANAGSVATARMTIEAAADRVVDAWIGFDIPARSNRNGVGIGEQGRWEGEASVKVNGQEMLPSASWQEPGSYAYHYHTWGRPEEEEPYTDEQLYWMRQPARMSLKKGKNVVEITIPKLYDGLRWSFAFIPVEVTGDGSVREAPGLKCL